MRRLLAILCLFAFMGAGLVLLGVGSNGSTTHVAGVPVGGAVARAAVRMSHVEGMRMSMVADVTADGQSLRMYGDGVFDGHSGIGRVDLDASGDAGSINLEEIFVARPPVEMAIYMRSPAFASKLPASKPWLKIDLLRESKKLGVDLGSLSSMQSSSPGQSLQWLRTAGDASIVGHARIHGVRTTHYRGTLDLTRLPDVVPAGQRDAVRKSLGALRKYLVSTSLPFDTWIDRRGRVRRLQEQIVEQVPSAGTMTMFFTFDLYDFGVRAQIAVPPDAATVDAASLHA